MALVDTRFNSHLPSLSVLTSNNVTKIGSVATVVVNSKVSPGKVPIYSSSGTTFISKVIVSDQPTNKTAGSSLTTSVFVNTSLPFQSSNANYKTFNINEISVYVLEDNLKYVPINAISVKSVASVPVEVSKVAVRVTTVVVEEPGKNFGFRTSLPYRYDELSIMTNEVLLNNKKPNIIKQQYITTKDSKTNNIVKNFSEDAVSVISVVKNNMTEKKRVSYYFNTTKNSTIARRSPAQLFTAFAYANVIDDANGVYSGSGTGGGGGGGGVTEYWS